MQQPEQDKLPLEGLIVLEFTHAVMGPTTGLLLADMGAEVIHIEPIEYFSFQFLVQLIHPHSKN